MTKLAELLKRLSRLSGDNPVQWVKVTPDDWVELGAMVEDAERYRWLRQGGSIKSQHPCPYKIQDSQLVVVGGVSLDDEIDAARNTTNKESA